MSRCIYLLFIDSYDSFTYNVVNLISNCIPGQDIRVTTIHNDSIDQLSVDLLQSFHGIIVGPGPGNPTDKVTIGILDQLFKIKTSSDSGDELGLKLRDIINAKPILGICLGWQAMCYYQDPQFARIEQLANIRHGQVYKMQLCDSFGQGTKKTLFENYPSQFESVRYHSLHVKLPFDYTSTGSLESVDGALLNSMKSIIPMVVCQDEDDGEILMGGKIRGKPWYGVQYHPESCCSELGTLLIKNFIQNVVLPESEHLQSSIDNPEYVAIRNLLNKKIDKTALLDTSCLSWPVSSCRENCKLVVKEYEPLIIKGDDHEIDIPGIVLRLGELIGPANFILLSSLMKQRNRGEYTVFGIPYDKKSNIYTYNCDAKCIATQKWNDFTKDAVIYKENMDRNDFWKFIELEMYKKKQTLQNQRVAHSKKFEESILNELPFIGGYLGILNYEMGDCVPLVNGGRSKDDAPDSVFVDIEQTIVWDHFGGKFYFIYNELHNDNGEFSALMNKIIRNLDGMGAVGDTSYKNNSKIDASLSYEIAKPLQKDYYQAFDKCQEYLHSGDSYELCLTTQCDVFVESTLEHHNNSDIGWEFFEKLTISNPAPFASFFSIPNCKTWFVSSSPERFLKWDSDLLDCELRPIKGTVKKTEDMTYEKAHEILKTRKEFGENLMIVDLIRNDLYELLPQVTMKELMSVEEYTTVYQLVSVISGSSLSNKDSAYTGLDILKHSLPPGSMTGAPKKSSVELLQTCIEPMVCAFDAYSTDTDSPNTHFSSINASHVRGLYSGVTGYYSLNGKGDFSVNIRCIFSQDNNKDESKNLKKHWKIGAGGAITVLSTKEGEWEEMLVKLNSTLQIFTN